MSETARIDTSDTAELRRLATSDGWAAAKAPIVREIVSLLDISNLPLGDERALAIEVSGRVLAAKVLQGFLNRVESSKEEPTEAFKKDMGFEVSSHVRIIE
jgi:hypothetical protein